MTGTQIDEMEVTLAPLSLVSLCALVEVGL